MIKKRISFLLALTVFVCGNSLCAFGASAPPEVSGEAVICMDAASGQVLYEKNADVPMLIASTTKILTALVVLECCTLDSVVEITAESAGVEGSSMYLKAGETYTVRELLYGLLLVSGNDAAHALAVFAAGSLENFASLMNRKAESLGCENSSFSNPHGLDAEDHYSTARDMAVLAANAMENEVFAEIVSTKSITIKENTYVNHNKLLWEYPYAIGLKTGYTMRAGRTLVSCAEYEGMRLVCVTLKDRDDWNDHRNLYQWAFDAYKCIAIPDLSGTKIPVVSGEDTCVGIMAPEPVQRLYEKDAAVSVSVCLPDFVYAPVEKGDILGDIRISTNEGETRVFLRAAEDILLDKKQKSPALRKFWQGLQIKIQKFRENIWKNDFKK